MKIQHRKAVAARRKDQGRKDQHRNQPSRAQERSAQKCAGPSRGMCNPSAALVQAAPCFRERKGEDFFSRAFKSETPLGFNLGR